MKTKFSKKIISLFLAVLMVVTSIPMFAISASAADEDHFLLAYFTGNDPAGTSTTDQTIRFAVSTDGLTYEKVNGGNQVIQQYIGTENARDPYIFKGQDGYFYCIATDADCSVGWWGNSNSMVIWRSSDLLNWTDGTIIRMSSIIDGSVYRCWAPEVLWNGNEYVVYFGLAADGYDNIETGNNTHMYYCTTTDLLDQSKYSTPKPLISNLSKDSIDGDIVECNGSYYLFYKDETNATICVIKSSSLPSSENSAPFDGSGLVKLNAGSSIGNLEGCEVFQNNNGEYIFMADRYSSNGNFAVYNLGTDLDVIFNNASVSSGVNTYTLPSQASHNLTTSGIGPRHGSVVKITEDQYNILKSATTFTTEAPADISSSTPVLPTEKNNGIDLSSNLIARYFVDDTTSDVATGQYGLSAQGSGASWISSSFGGHGAAYFSSDNYMYTGSVASMLSSTTASQGITFSFYGLPKEYDAYGRYFEMNSNGIKGSVVWNSTGNYISTKATKDGAETIEVETVNNNNFTWCDDANPTGGRWGGTASYTASQWNHFTVTLNDTHVCLYINGEQKFDLTRDNAITSAIIDSFKSGGYLLLGASGYSDTTYDGYMRDFRVYNKAVTSDEATKLYNQYGYDNSYSVTEIKQAMSNYETKMNNALSNKTLLTNMQGAYDAYVALRKGFDAYYYGGDNTIDIEGLAVALITKTDAMTTWSAYTANNPKPTFSSDGSGDVADSYVNLLYTGTGTQSTASVADTGSVRFTFQVGYNDTVMMYDGTAPRTRVMYMCQVPSKTAGGNKTRTPMSCYPTTGSGNSDDHDSLYLVAQWKGGYNSNWDYPTQYNSGTYSFGHNSTTASAGRSMGSSWSGASASSWYGYSNILEFDKNYNWNGSYLASFENVWWASWSGDNAKSDLLTDDSSTNIYVINYKALLEAIDTAKGKLPTSLDGYKQGNSVLSSLLGALDKGTSCNPNDYFTSVSTLTDNVNGCVSAIKTAVETLSSQSTPTASDYDETNYSSLRTAMDKFFDGTVTLDDDVYTVESIDEYTKVFDAAKTIFTHVYSVAYDQNDRAGAFATALGEILNPLKSVDLDGLYNAIASKSIFDASGNQIYTYDSWADELSSYMKTYSDLNNVTCQYKTTTATLTDGNDATVTYEKLSTPYQTDADNAATAVAGVTLTSVDAADCYTNFDASVQVANTLEQDKYTDYSDLEGVVKTQTDVVYRTIIAAEAETYNAFFNTNNISAGQVLKKSTTGVTDPATATVLNKANTLTAKTFNTYLQVVDKDGTVGSKSLVSTNNYGDLITVKSGVTDIPVAWTVELYSDKECTAENYMKPITYAGFSGTTLQIKTESNAVVTAKPAYDEAPASGVAVRVYNGYNNLIDVVYADSLANAQTEINKIKTSMPFYAFNSWDWDNCKEVKTGIYEVTPIFDSATQVTIKTIDGSSETTKTVNINSAATVSSSTPHYGWAVKTASGKYQIVAYTDGDYKFSALVNETYVPIIENGGSYYVADGATNVQLTATNVDGFDKPDVDTINDQNFLNAKLAQKSPFVYFQAVDNITESPKVKVYMRTTAGNYISDADSFAFGIVLNGQKFKVKARNELTGQFYCRLSETNAAYLATSEAFVTYNYEYSGYGNLATTDTNAFADSSLA